MSRIFRFKPPLLATAQAVMGVFAAHAQNAVSTGAITGTVHDASGAVLPHATVTATNTSTGVTLTQSIATGFAALEVQTQQELGSLPSAVAAQFKQLEATLATEETRFTAFATRRFAYQAAQPATGQTQDVSA